MAYSDFDNITSIPDLITEVSSQSNYFGTGIIIFIWLGIALTGYFSQDRKTGRASMPLWLTVGGFFSTGVSFILLMVGGIINLATVGIVLVLFIIFSAWLLFSDDK